MCVHRESVPVFLGGHYRLNRSPEVDDRPSENLVGAVRKTRYANDHAGLICQRISDSDIDQMSSSVTQVAVSGDGNTSHIHPSKATRNGVVDRNLASVRLSILYSPDGIGELAE